MVTLDTARSKNTPPTPLELQRSPDHRSERIVALTVRYSYRDLLRLYISPPVSNASLIPFYSPAEPGITSHPPNVPGLLLIRLSHLGRSVGGPLYLPTGLFYLSFASDWRERLSLFGGQQTFAILFLESPFLTSLTASASLFCTKPGVRSREDSGYESLAPTIVYQNLVPLYPLLTPYPPLFKWAAQAQTFQQS